jgi:hypothetical protein
MYYEQRRRRSCGGTAFPRMLMAPSAPARIKMDINEHDHRFKVDLPSHTETNRPPCLLRDLPGCKKRRGYGEWRDPCEIRTHLQRQTP